MRIEEKNLLRRFEDSLRISLWFTVYVCIHLVITLDTVYIRTIARMYIIRRYKYK